MLSFVIGNKSNLTFKISKALRKWFVGGIADADSVRGCSLQPELVSPAFVSLSLFRMNACISLKKKCIGLDSQGLQDFLVGQLLTRVLSLQEAWVQPCCGKLDPACLQAKVKQ